MNIDLKGKRILVTGASRGLGYSIATHLLDAGARVALHYNRSREGVEQIHSRYPSQAVMVGADLSDLKSTEALFRNAVEELGGQARALLAEREDAAFGERRRLQRHGAGPCRHW